jgi:guanidinopropionase
MSMIPNTFFQPVDGMELPRFAGIPSFMRLPHLGLDSAKLMMWILV